MLSNKFPPHRHHHLSIHNKAYVYEWGHLEGYKKHHMNVLEKKGLRNDCHQCGMGWSEERFRPQKYPSSLLWYEFMINVYSF